METGKVINKISNRLRRRSKKIQESIGISGAKGNILNYILVESENHPVYQKEIEEEFGLRPSTATETLKNLEQAELICRVPESEDGRYKKIVFTEQARKIEHILRIGRTFITGNYGRRKKRIFKNCREDASESGMRNLKLQEVDEWLWKADFTGRKEGLQWTKMN